MNVFFDIETIPQQPEEEVKALIAETITAPAQMKKQETIDDWHNGVGKYAGEKDALIEAEYRKTSFDGGKGEICSIAWAFGDQTVMSLYRTPEESEKEMLELFFENLSEVNTPFFIGHYVAGFDLKFLFHRCVVLGVNPGFKIKFAGRHGIDFYCTMTAWAGFKDRISQDNLCKALGIEGKPTDIDGSKVWDYVKAGDIQTVQEYNKDDVKKVRRIYDRLHFNG